jgi:hypothetical protein
MCLRQNSSRTQDDGRAAESENVEESRNETQRKAADFRHSEIEVGEELGVENGVEDGVGPRMEKQPIKTAQVS